MRPPYGGVLPPPPPPPPAPPPPPPPPRSRPGTDSRPWEDLTIEQPGDNRALAASLLVAAGTDAAVRAGVTGLAGACLVAMVALTLVGSGRIPSRQAQAAVLAAPLFGMWLAARSSPWLLVPDVLAAAILLVLGSSLSRGGSILDLHLPGLFWRGWHAVLHGATGPVFVLGHVRLPSSRRGFAVLRGMMLAAPLVLVLGLLLSSADAVFASFFRLSLDPVSIAEHAIALVFGGWAMAGLLRLCSGAPLAEVRTRKLRLGRAEALTVLACLDALYAAFAAAQLVALSSGGRRVIETAGLTYADYARNGFFQLLAVAGLTLAILPALVTMSSKADPVIGVEDGVPSRRALVLLAEAAVALTLVIVVVALRRLWLYEQTFGLTMLRLYSSLLAAWIGTAFVLLGIRMAGVGGRRSWFVPAAVALGLVALLGLNAVNPEAVVVRHNVSHAERTGGFDAEYATGLSTDAIRTLVASLPRLQEGDRGRVLAGLCSQRPPSAGWLSYNGGVDAAVEAKNRVCS